MDDDVAQEEEEDGGNLKKKKKRGEMVCKLAMPVAMHPSVFLQTTEMCVELMCALMCDVCTLVHLLTHSAWVGLGRLDLFVRVLSAFGTRLDALSLVLLLLLSLPRCGRGPNTRSFVAPYMGGSIGHQAREDDTVLRM